MRRRQTKLESCQRVLDKNKAKVSLDILNPDFLNEMDEYAEAVLKNKHMLGVLFRGTDYKIMCDGFLASSHCSGVATVRIDGKERRIKNT